eukprot:2680196-Alexandrium_andersonii.AAC.1
MGRGCRRGAAAPLGSRSGPQEAPVLEEGVEELLSQYRLRLSAGLKDTREAHVVLDDRRKRP